jgi:hypothetical protein
MRPSAPHHQRLTATQIGPIAIGSWCILRAVRMSCAAPGAEHARPPRACRAGAPNALGADGTGTGAVRNRKGLNLTSGNRKAAPERIARMRLSKAQRIVEAKINSSDGSADATATDSATDAGGASSNRPSRAN